MIKGKILLISLLAAGVIGAILGIIQMWWEPMAWEQFLRTMATITVLGVLISFFTAVDYDLPSSKGKALLGVAVVIAFALSGLLIAQLWWQPLETGTFIKLIATAVILLGLVSFVIAVVEDFGTNKKLRDEKYID